LKEGEAKLFYLADLEDIEPEKKLLVEFYFVLLKLNPITFSCFLFTSANEEL
jgi:hypothetical protein